MKYCAKIIATMIAAMMLCAMVSCYAEDSIVTYAIKTFGVADKKEPTTEDTSNPSLIVVYWKVEEADYEKDLESSGTCMVTLYAEGKQYSWNEVSINEILPDIALFSLHYPDIKIWMSVGEYDCSKWE